MAHFRLGLTFAQQKKYDEAIAELETAVGISNDRDAIAALGYVQGLAGSKATVETVLAELDEREKTGFVTSYNRVLLAIGLNDYDAALDWLERAYDERSYWLIYLKVDPALDVLRENPRFKNLEEKIFGADGFDVQPRRKTFVEKTAAPIADRRRAKSVFCDSGGSGDCRFTAVGNLCLAAPFRFQICELAKSIRRAESENHTAHARPPRARQRIYAGREIYRLHLA